MTKNRDKIVKYKINKSWYDIFAISPTPTNTAELESCGLLWCFYQLFGLSFWRHPPIHWGSIGEQVMQFRIYPNLFQWRKNSSTSWMAFFCCWVNYFFKGTAHPKMILLSSHPNGLIASAEHKRGNSGKSNKINCNNGPYDFCLIFQVSFCVLEEKNNYYLNIL